MAQDFMFGAQNAVDDGSTVAGEHLENCKAQRDGLGAELCIGSGNWSTVMGCCDNCTKSGWKWCCTKNLTTWQAERQIQEQHQVLCTGGVSSGPYSPGRKWEWE